jgi:hypothetical protein
VSAKDLAGYARLQWSSLQRIVSDLTLLDDMNPALILHNLKQRFERDQVREFFAFPPTFSGKCLFSISFLERFFGEK